MLEWAVAVLAALLAVAMLAALVCALLARRRPASPVHSGPVPPDLSAGPGEVVLLLVSAQFSVDCRHARSVVAEVAAETVGVVHHEVDVASRPELVALLDVRRTPTTLLVDARGVELSRVAGVPRRRDLLAVLAGEPHGPAGRRRDDQEPASGA